MTESAKLELEVVPNSKESSIGFNDWTKALRLKLKAKAQNGKANKELLEIIEQAFDAKAKIISGQKGRKKTVLLEGISQATADEIIRKINP